MPSCIEAKPYGNSRYTALVFVALAAFVLFVGLASPSLADIGGSTSDEEISNQNWPEGAEAVFNFKGRVAFWDGPPLGGGHWHAECRGDAKQLSDVLAAFERIKAQDKRIVLHNGVGQSFWLNPNGDPAKVEAAKIDWTFAVWDKESWQRIMDVKKAGDAPGDAMEPPVQIDVYTGGNVNWKDVVVPKGLTVVDQRR
jgi:hypothetical protein